MATFSNTLSSNPGVNLNSGTRSPTVPFQVYNIPNASTTTQTTTPKMAVQSTINKPNPTYINTPGGNITGAMGKFSNPNEGQLATPGNITNVDQATAAGKFDSSQGAGAYNSLINRGGTPSLTVPQGTQNQNLYTSSQPQVAPQSSNQSLSYPGLISNILNTANTGANNIAAYSTLNPAYAKTYNAITNLESGLQAGNNEIMTKPIPLTTQGGQMAALQRDYGPQLTALKGILGEMNTQQQLGQSGAIAGGQLATGAAGTAAGLAKPESYSLYSQPYFPASDSFGGGGSGGAINRSIQASNIGSAGDFQTKIQNIQATANAADHNFNILNSYAQGFGGDIPILNGLKQLYGTTLQGNQAIAGFQAQLQNVRAAYQTITGGDPISAIPDTITPNQLRQVQQALSNTAANTVTGYQNQLGSLGGGNYGGSNNDPLGLFQ